MLLLALKYYISFINEFGWTTILLGVIVTSIGCLDGQMWTVFTHFEVKINANIKIDKGSITNAYMILHTTRFEEMRSIIYFRSLIFAFAYPIQGLIKGISKTIALKM